MVHERINALSDAQRRHKRLLDIVIGTILILITFPIMLIVILIQLIASDGSILFKQERVGENGRLFTMYKFRTMVDGADTVERAGGPHKQRNDVRVTRTGRFLRRFSLDELPQFFHVLNGDMSLVGPRPELPSVVANYESWQYARLAVPQGLTGWWQINGRSDKPLPLQMEDDLYYIQNYSFAMDCYILLKTPWIVLNGRGAY